MLPAKPAASMTEALPELEARVSAHQRRLLASLTELGEGIDRLKAERDELLAALKAVLPYAESRVEDLQDMVDVLDDAGSARGEDGVLLAVAEQALIDARAAIAKAEAQP